MCRHRMWLADLQQWQGELRRVAEHRGGGTHHHDAFVEFAGDDRGDGLTGVDGAAHHRLAERVDEDHAGGCEVAPERAALDRAGHRDAHPDHVLATEPEAREQTVDDAVQDYLWIRPRTRCAGGSAGRRPAIGRSSSR